MTRPRPDATPLLSVVVPAYGVEEHLEDCVASILGQDIDQEVILVVDGSPDRTGEIAQRLAVRHPQVRVIDNPRTLGPGASRNMGLRDARGSYVAFPDSDDLVAEGAYRAVIDTLESTGSDFATSRADEFGRAPGRSRYWTLRADVFDTGVRGTTLDEHPELVWDHTAWTKIFRREFLLEQGIWWPEGVLCEDVVPAVRSYAAARAIDVVPRCTYLYRRRDGSITSRLTAAASLRDWSSQSRAAIRALEAAGQHNALQHMLEKVLRHEVPARVAAARADADPELVAEVDALLRDVCDKAAGETLDRVPVEALLAAKGVAAHLSTASASPPPAAPGEAVPLVSVVVPTRDVEPWIDECLQSLLAQDHGALEVLVVDDHSTDGTWERVLEYAAQDPRLTALRNPGVGGADARSAGVERATGEYLIFADGDDIVPLHAYSRLVEAARRDDAQVVVGGFLRIWATGAWRATGYGLETPATGITLAERPRLIRNRTCWNKLVRRDFWNGCGLRFPTAPRANDILPVTRLLLEAQRISVIPETVYEYRMRPGGASMTGSLGTVSSTLAYLVQERACAQVLAPLRGSRVAVEYWTSVLGGDVWTALGRLLDAEQTPDTDSLGQIAGSLGMLLDQAPSEALWAIGPRRRLGLALASRGDLHGLSVLRERDAALGQRGRAVPAPVSPRSTAAERLRRAVLEVAEVLDRAAPQGLHASSIATVLREDVLVPLLEAPQAWGTSTAVCAETADLVQTIGSLAAHLEIGEAATPGTPEPRLLAALLMPGQPSRALLQQALGGVVHAVPATLEEVSQRRVTVVGRGPAPRRLFVRTPDGRPDAWKGGSAGLPVPADVNEQQGGWSAVLDLAGLPTGQDYVLHAVVPDALGVGVANVALQPTVRPGPLDPIRVSGAGAESTLRVLEGGPSRLRRAVSWRLQKASRSLARRRGARKGV